MSDLSDSFIAKLPHSRSAAVHTAYAKAPDYIVSAINQHCDKLRCIKDTEYETDCYGHYVLNRYGMRVKEPCHYSPMEHHIAMHNDMTDAEYADVLQHELGHFIDDVLGRPSTGDRFRQAFSDAAARYSTDTPHGRMMLNDMLDDAFSTGAAFDRNITDIISALTHNNPVVVRRFTESMLLLLLIDLFRFGKKEHQITLIVSVLWVTAISLALGILKAMKKPLRFTMKSYGETPTIIKHYARLVVCTVTDGDLHKISPTLLPCLKMHGEKVPAELRQKSVCCICSIWKKP